MLEKMGKFKRVNIINANHAIVIFKNGWVLQSYNSIVVVSYLGKLYLGKNWDFSKTTVRYVCEFVGYSPKELRKLIKNGDIEVLEEV